MKKVKPRTLKQRKWLKEYIKSGNATQAALKVYDTTSKDVAKRIGWENATKLNLSVIMDAKGLTDDRLMEDTKNGLETVKKEKSHTEEDVWMPDHAVRHKFLETALRLKGHGTNSDTNINIDARTQIKVDVNTMLEKVYGDKQKSA